MSNLSDTSDKNKIGEIYFINKTFRIFCNCGGRFNNIKIFTKHFLLDHLNLNNQSIEVSDELLIKRANQIDNALEINDENPIAINNVDKKKIGEIYFINKTFRILCDCGERFNNIKIFTKHFLQDHLNLNNQSIKILDELLIYKANQIHKCAQMNDEFNLKNEDDSDSIRDQIDISEESVYNENSISDSGISNFKIFLENNNETISTKESLNDNTDYVNGNEEDEVFLISDEKEIVNIINAKRKNHDESKKKIWSCDPCGEKFNRQKTFLKHKLDIHNEILKCILCGKFFSTVKRLQYHERLRHSFVITKYKCKWCDRMYNRPEQCTYHENTYHDSNGKKVQRKYKYTLNHVCEKCGEGFTLPVKLREHIRIKHTGERPLKCDMCSKSFAKKRELSIHKYSHMEELPYKCGYCNKGFFQKSLCKAHEMIHTGCNKVECKLCGKKYSRGSDLNRHMKRIHKINTKSK